MAVELRFDPAFVEEAVFLELNRLTTAGSHQTVSSFHRAREAVYELPDAQQREAAFQQLARRYFQALRLSELFAERLSEFPRLSSRLELAVIRRVWDRKDEQVELYVGRPGEARPALEVSTTLLIGLQAVRCLDRGKLTAFLRHELMHVADMLDPAFVYDPHPAFAPRPAGVAGSDPPQCGGADGAPTGRGVGGECEPEHELIRERFRVLWDLWVHARLRRMGWQAVLTDDARGQEVERAFASLDAAARRELSTTVSGRDRWTQDELLTLARRQRVEVVA
ncbi:MAG: hypothetical protein HYY91_06210 [Candidatus Omnitrophica bacterium]|nr:hypothetical protein [Candidatus Omnitrophota bacterium]